MGYKIAIVGKGGVGKTTIAGTLSRLFARNGYRVIAIDADPSMNLSTAIGISNEDLKKIKPISEQKKIIEERAGTQGGVFVLNPKVDDLPDKFQVIGPDGVRLLVMGTVQTPASGCMCPDNALIRALIYHLILETKDVVILDMVAGIEHLGRGTAKAVDAMIIVVEPGNRSIVLAKTIRDLASELGIKKIFLVGNKISSDFELNFIKNKAKELGIEVLSNIPLDQKIKEADLKSIAPIDNDENSKGIEVIKYLYEQIIMNIEKRV
ncbi:MAG: nucleotide-binding protein [Candidatus Helarchaeota archaeon]